MMSVLINVCVLPRGREKQEELVNFIPIGSSCRPISIVQTQQRSVGMEGKITYPK